MVAATGEASGTATGGDAKLEIRGEIFSSIMSIF